MHRLLLADYIPSLKRPGSIVPGIYDLEVTETWAGLRPGSRDNDPILRCF